MEQPSSSLFPEFPYMAFVESRFGRHVPIELVRLQGSWSGARKVTCSKYKLLTCLFADLCALSCMGSYGHGSVKPSLLIGTAPGSYMPTYLYS